MKTRTLSTHAPEALSTALDILQQGGIVAFPTDTVYGLGASLHNPTGIGRLFQAKDRAPSKAIAVLISSVKELDQVAGDLNRVVENLAHQFWPGPLTLVVPRHPSLPQILGPLPTIGVRMPDHSDALALLQRTGPLAVTSANLSGRNNACSAMEVYKQLGGKVQLILDGGETPGGTPSTVIDCTTSTFKTLRAGPITIEMIETFLARK